jgi:NADPH2:quinone reductase
MRHRRLRLRTVGRMWAIQIEVNGGPEVLQWRELPDPIAGDGQAVVEIAAAGLNFVDTYHRSGLYPLPLPRVLGLEGSGTVLEVGAGVTSVRVGDRVAWPSNPGCYATRVALDADRIVAIPDSVDMDTAAALPLQGMTAHYLATDTFTLTQGSKCLIHAGAGGTGLLLTQMAKIHGAEVFTTVGTPEKAELSRSAGADHVILYNDVDFAEAVESIAGPRALDVVYDGVGQSVFDQSLTLIRPRGVMATFGNASGAVPPVSPLALAVSIYLTRPTLGDYLATSSEIQRRAADIFGWVVQGALDVRIGARFALEDAADAHRALEGRQTTGKVILTP